MAPKIPPNRFLQEYGFATNDDIPISLAFGQVSQARGWKKGSKRWKKAWNACMHAEYDRSIGSRVSKLDCWQHLCAKVGIEELLPSIAKCKKALAKVHVNIVDLLDCWEGSEIPKRFNSRKALADYTADTERYFNRSIAKQDKILKVLLRRLL